MRTKIGLIIHCKQFLFPEVKFWLNLQCNQHEILKSVICFVLMLKHSSHSLNMWKQSQRDQISLYNFIFPDVRFWLDLHRNRNEIWNVWNVYIFMLKHPSHSLNMWKQWKSDQISLYNFIFLDLWFWLDLRHNRHEIWKVWNVYALMLKHPSHHLNMW